jgi:hypothetical protein
MYKCPILNSIGQVGGRGFEGCMIQLFRYGNVLPRLYGNNRWRSRVAFNHIRFYDGL